MNEDRIGDFFEWQAAEIPGSPTPADLFGGDADGTPPPVPVTCWRCGKAAEAAGEFCHYCRARLARGSTGEGERVGRAAGAELKLLVRLIGVFVVLLAISLVFGWVQQFGFKQPADWNGEQLHTQLNLMLFVEFLDTALIALAALWLSRPAPQTKPSTGVRVAAWTVAAPVLLGLLGVNLGYCWLIRTYVGFPPVQDLMIAEFGLSAQIWFCYCIQPAIVEELFFRYLALGTLRGVTGVHGAVLVSAVMFGVAHIFNPLAIPVLVLIGVALGYARVASGGLVLPVLMHFGHNAAIVVIEALL